MPAFTDIYSCYKYYPTFTKVPQPPIMSKQFIKRRNSHQKLTPGQTWSSGDPYLTTKLNKLVRPPRKLIQNFMTTQHEYDQSYRDVQSSEAHFLEDNPALKSKQIKTKHRKRLSHNQEEDQDDEDRGAGDNNGRNFHGVDRMGRSSKEMLPDSSKDIELRLQQIESIMGQQNQNLRQQKQYLMRTIYKLQQKQKEYKSSLSQYRQRTIQLQEQNQILREKYQKARDFITTGIGKMQQVISKQSMQNIAHSQINSNSNSNNHTAYQSSQSSVNLTQSIDQLNDKFDALMYQYQKTRQPQLRKQCMEIAKELKKLRKLQESQKKG